MDLSSISLGMAKIHYTNAGIKENKTFSVNIPSAGMVKKTDYCGLVSGKRVDKSRLFENFCGKLETAPMIKQCPINTECRLIKTVDFPKHDVFVGEVVETYCDEQCLKDGGKFMGGVQELGKVVRQEGPLDEKTAHLVQLAAGTTQRSEGAVHSHVRRAIEVRARPEEIYHSIILLTSTIGFPTVSAALSWAADVIGDKK